MKKSQLVAIIKRLEAMTEATDNEIQVRRFERDGEERCIVTYDSETEMFNLKESSAEEGYEFDDIDLVAIEIFELLQA